MHLTAFLSVLARVDEAGGSTVGSYFGKPDAFAVGTTPSLGFGSGVRNVGSRSHPHDSCHITKTAKLHYSSADRDCAILSLRIQI